MAGPAQTSFRRAPTWALASGAVACALIVLTWGAAPDLAPAFRGVLLGCVFWSAILSLWEFFVPLVRIESDGTRLVVRPALLIAKRETPLDGLAGVDDGRNKIRLSFHDRESFTIPRKRLTPDASEALVAALRSRVVSRGRRPARSAKP